MTAFSVSRTPETRRERCKFGAFCKGIVVALCILSYAAVFRFAFLLPFTTKEEIIGFLEGQFFNNTLKRNESISGSYQDVKKIVVGEHQKEAELSAMQCSPMWGYNTSSVKPMWIPGYPGSGSEMLRKLVISIAGIGGSAIYNSECRGPTATCKTHWPFIGNRYLPSDYSHVFASRSALLIRNPKDALPSYCNFEYETSNGLRSHSTQAPEEEWIKWRDVSCLRMLESWAGVIRSWKLLEDYQIAFYLPYERLASIESGPQLLSKLAAELRRNHVTVAPEEDIACLWYQVVKGKKDTKTKRATHKYVPGYTAEQQAAMLRELEKLQEDFSNDTELVEILTTYHQDIRSTMRVFDGPTNTTNLKPS